MERLYIETKSRLIQVNELLTKYENTINNESSENMIKSQLDDVLNNINSNFSQLDIYVTKEPPIRKYDSKMKVDQIKYDFQHYKTAFNSIQYRKNKRIEEEKRREELLRSTTVNSSSHVICLENDQNELKHFKRMHNTNREMDRMIAHGEDTLANLKEQNSALKFIKTKMLTVTNSLGLSNTLIRMIERRNKSDKVFLYGGMIVTLIIMFLVVKYLM